MPEVRPFGRAFVQGHPRDTLPHRSQHICSPGAGERVGRSLVNHNRG